MDESMPITPRSVMGRCQVAKAKRNAKHVPETPLRIIVGFVVKKLPVRDGSPDPMP
jgi:hypothetical protein